MKFKKKPVVIEAIHWNGISLSETPQWISDALNKTPGDMGSIFRHGQEVLIYTLEGTITASAGDWIIKGVSGELYPCKNEIFLETYEKV